MKSSLEYVQSKHNAELNSTSEQEEFSEKDKEDAIKPLPYQDSVEAMENWDQNIHETLLNSSKSDTDESQHHRNPAISDPQETVGADQLLHRHEDEDMQWKIEKMQKHLLILAFLVVTIIYEAGLSPPGTLWQENKADHVVGKFVPNDNHRRRNMAFFYCNATAFLSSVTIIVLLVSRKLFATKIQYNVITASIILDMFGLMGAFTAGTSSRVPTSLLVYAAVTVLAYIMVHVLVRIDSGSLAETSILGHKDEDMKWKPEKRCKRLLLFAALAVTITYQAGLSPPGSLWQDYKAYHVDDTMSNDNHRRRYMAFFYCNATAFLSSVTIIVLLVNRKLFATRIQYNVITASMILDLFGLMGAFTAGSSWRVSTSLLVYAAVAVVAYIMVHVLVRIDSGSLGETYVLGHEDDDMKWKLEKRHKRLLLLAVIAVSITYQAGLSPPGSLWQENKADHVDDPVPNDNHRGRYMAFIYCNATAFLSSVTIIVLLVNRKLFATRIQYNVITASIILVMFGLMGAFIAGSSWRVSTSLLVCAAVAVLVYIMVHVLVRIGSGSLAETSVLGHEDEDMKWKPENRRKLLLLLAVLAVSVAYQAGLSPPGSLWQENKADHVVGDPVPNDNHPRRYMAFFYCNATAFVSSLATIMLVIGRKLFERGTQSNVLSACVNLDLIGLTGAFAAISSRRVSTSIYVFILHFAVLVCIMAQVLGKGGSGSLAETSVLGHNGGRSRYLLIFAAQSLFGQIGVNAAGRCSESADTAVIYEDNPNRSIKRSPHEATWRVVCAASHHMTGNQSVLLTSSYLPAHDSGNDGEVVLVNPAKNGETVPLRVQGSGSVRTESIALDDVWHVPGLDSNLVSTGQLARQGCAVNLGPGGCRITRDGALVGTARFTEECQFELDFLKVAASSM